jgi:CRP-like cAMP-binding protein
MAMLSNLDLILRVPIFSTITSEQAQVVAANVTKKRYKRNEYIVKQGERSHALSILISGSAQVVSTNASEKEVIITHLGPGDYVGEMSLIDNEVHSASVITESQCDVLVLGQEQFAQCLIGNHAMAYGIMRGLVKRLRHADAKIESLALLDVYGRVARVLLEFAKKQPDGTMLIKGRVSRQDVAKMVGASREMVSRVMKDIEERGYVQTLESGDMVVHEKISDFSK